MTGPDKCIIVGGPCEGLNLLNHLLPLAHNLQSTDDIRVCAVGAHGVRTIWHLSAVRGPIHDQSCCATLRVVQHDWQCMVLIDLIVYGQTCVAQNNFAQHDWSCMGRISLLFRLHSYWRLRCLHSDMSVILGASRNLSVGWGGEGGVPCLPGGAVRRFADKLTFKMLTCILTDRSKVLGREE
jgi:hypothetical protein